MRPFTTVRSIVAPVPIKDVDTDMIIPAQYLTSISRDGFGQGLFSRLRATYPDFYMNQERYAGARILVADTNFGCGSSREHAVWALLGGGIRVVIAPSFADIFTNNSGKNGLLLVKLDEMIVQEFLRDSHNGALHLTVDLAAQRVATDDGRSWSFMYDPFLKHCVMNGLDELDYPRSRLDLISKKKAEQQASWFVGAPTPR